MNQMTMHFHAQTGKKLEDVKKYLLERYDSIEIVIELENDIVKITKLHNKNFEGKIIINTNDIVTSCFVKYINKIKHNNNCIIL